MDDRKVFIINSAVARNHGEMLEKLLLDGEQLIICDDNHDLDKREPKCMDIEHSNIHRRNKSDRKRNRANRWR